jgi:hypothetical protein
MLKQRALVRRGVLVRGDVKEEGAILDVVTHPSSTNEITHQEFAELKSSNFVTEVVEKPHEPLSSQQAAAVDVKTGIKK